MVYAKNKHHGINSMVNNTIINNIILLLSSRVVILGKTVMGIYIIFDNRDSFLIIYCEHSFTRRNHGKIPIFLVGYHTSH